MVRISEKKLLEILEKNARLPFVKIAKKLRVSEAAIRKKVKKLEKEGVIKKYTIEIEPTKVGYEIVAFIGVDTTPENFIKILEILKREKKVKHLYSCTGDHMLLAECWLENHEELENFVKKIEKIQGVKKVCPAIILKEIK